MKINGTFSYETLSFGTIGLKTINSGKQMKTNVTEVRQYRVACLTLLALIIGLLSTTGLQAQSPREIPAGQASSNETSSYDALQRRQVPNVVADRMIHQLLTEYAEELAITETQKTALLQWQFQKRGDERARRLERMKEGRRNDRDGRNGVGFNRQRPQQPGGAWQRRLERQDAGQRGGGQYNRRGDAMPGRGMAPQRGITPQRGDVMPGRGVAPQRGDAMPGRGMAPQRSEQARRSEIPGRPEMRDRALQRLSSSIEMKQKTSEILSEDQFTGWKNLQIKEAEQEFEVRMLRLQIRLENAGVTGEKLTRVLTLLREQAELTHEHRIAEIGRMKMPDEQELQRLQEQRKTMRESLRQTNEQIKNLLTAKEYEQFRGRM